MVKPPTIFWGCVACCWAAIFWIRHRCRFGWPRPARQGDRIGEIYRGVLEVCLGQREAIVAKFPPLNRFLTGYDLRHVLSDDLQRVDLSRLLAGSEGTLALVTEARLRIIPLPQVRRLVNVKYDSFDAALRNAPLMLEANALSVETIDSQVLALARRDIIWHGVRDLIDDRADRPLQGLNIVEFAGDDEPAITAQVAALCQRLEAMAKAGEGGVIGYRLSGDEADIERIYGMRKRAVGLLGNAQGRPSLSRLSRIPACLRRIWLIISPSFAPFWISIS